MSQTGSYTASNPLSFSTPQPLATNHPPESHASQPNGSRRYHFVRCLTLALVLLFLIISAIFSLAWLILNPIPPIVIVNSLFASNFTLCNQKVVAYYDVGLTVRSPNKKISLLIDYDYIFVLYRKTPISERASKSVPPLYLEKMSEKNQSFTLGPELHHSMDGKIFKNLSEDWSKRVVQVTVEMMIDTKFMAEKWASKRKQMRVFCPNLSLQFLSAKEMGKLVAGGKECLVRYA